jgi:anti-sigma regulatory factor (Ser/Thr protein kinase)
VVEASGYREFPGQADQVSLARRFVVDALGSRSELCDEVSLLVSEAVTNALLHSSSGQDHGTFTVVYQLFPACMRVEVHDGGAPMAPRRRVHDLESVTGRGLDLFEALADRWGYRGDERGRVVWFELDLREEVEHGAQAGTVRSRSARA